MTKKKIGLIVVAVVLLVAIVATSIILALNLSYTYSPAEAENIIAPGETCEITIEYNGAKGKPEKEVVHAEAYTEYVFPEVEKDGYKFFCWFCDFVAYQKSVPIYSKKIRAIAQFERDYSLVSAPCALYDSGTDFKEYEVGEYSDVNKKVVDLYIEGGYVAKVYSKKNFKGKETQVTYQGTFTGKVGSLKIIKLNTQKVEVPNLNDDTKAKLLKDYSPRLWWDKDEKYYASSVEFALENLTRTLSPYGYMGVLEDLDSPKYKSDYFYGDKDGMKAYGFAVEKEYTYLDLCYYLFFPYNKAKTVLGMEFGNHVGDWEHMIVRLKVSNEGGKTYIEPVFAQYSIHSERIYMPWTDVPKCEGEHPVGYIANGSHGIWPKAGKNVYKNFVILKLTDICSEGEAWDLWDNNNLETYSYDALTWTGDGIGDSTWNTCFDHDFYNEDSNSITRWGNFGFKYPVQLYPQLQNPPEGPTCKKGVFDYYAIDTRFVY